MWKTLIAYILLIYVFPPLSHAQVAKQYPLDEAVDDPSFFLFRSRLLNAVTERDTTFLYAHLSSGIRSSFGGDDGIAEFRKWWRHEEPESPLWSTLAGVVSLGGGFYTDPVIGDRAFHAPYYFHTFPDGLDVFEHGVVLGESVRVREKPNTSSRVLSTLSYDIVEVTSFVQDRDEEELPPGWHRVKLSDGTAGYVSAEFIGSPIDYRAGFRKEDGVWRMGFFLAGE